MKFTRLLCFLILLCSVSVRADDAPLKCPQCLAWNQPQQPFNVYGNTWYVGTSELSSVLISGPQGLILLDGDLPQSAQLIQKNIRALGFRIEDVKLIVNSHAHYDHAGGIAALQKASGAIVAASASGALVLKNGTIGKDDPQFTASGAVHVRKVAQVQVVQDGEVLHVGDLAITAHLTPGHTPGSTTWTWKSCEASRCLNVVYADSLNPVVAGNFRYTGDKHHPDISGLFKSSIAKVANLPCDIVLSVHPGVSDTFEKLAKKTLSNNPFITPAGCKDYAAEADKLLDARIGQERNDKK